MLKLLVVAALLIPNVARAEFVSKKSPEVRVATAAKIEPLTVDGMLHKINSVYMLGLQRCYVKGLAHDPTLAGKVSVVFTVNPWGRVTGTVTGVSAKVDACLSTQLATWRFPSPRDANDRPTQASFKISLLLRQ